MNVNWLEKDNDVVFTGLLHRLFAGIAGEQNRRNSRIILACHVDYFKAGMLLLQRIIAQQQVELMLRQYCHGFCRGLNRLHCVTALFEDQFVGHEHRRLIIHNENAELPVTPQWAPPEDRS